MALGASGFHPHKPAPAPPPSAPPTPPAWGTPPVPSGPLPHPTPPARPPRFAGVRPNPQLPHVHQHLVAMIPLIVHQFFDPLRGDLIGRLRIVGHFPQLLRRLHHRLI